MTVDLQKAVVLLHAPTKNVDKSILDMCRFPGYPTPGLPSIIRNVEVFQIVHSECADGLIDFLDRVSNNNSSSRCC